MKICQVSQGWIAPDIVEPIVVGFGINTPEAAHDMALHADGAVVGSAIVSKIAAGESVESVLSFVKSLADGAHSAKN